MYTLNKKKHTQTYILTARPERKEPPQKTCTPSSPRCSTTSSPPRCSTCPTTHHRSRTFASGLHGHVAQRQEVDLLRGEESFSPRTVVEFWVNRGVRGISTGLHKKESTGYQHSVRRLLYNKGARRGQSCSASVKIYVVSL